MNLRKLVNNVLYKLNLEYLGPRRDGFIGILTLNGRRYAVGIDFDYQDTQQSVEAKTKMVANSATLTYHLKTNDIKRA